MRALNEAIKYSRDFLTGLLEKMLLVNRFEEAVKGFYAEGIIHGTLHLCIGEEAAVVGSTAALEKDDYIFTTHRNHGESIGKGSDLYAMMAEILGRKDGCNMGRGGSMHICDPDCGVMGANGIVGADAPLACGAALSIRKKGLKNRVAVCFTGDGAANQGAVMESMNLAGLWKLPLIFVLLENHYAVSTTVERGSANTDFTARAAAFGLTAWETDGDDVLKSFEAVSEARRHVVEGKGPALVILHTYRMSGHSRSDDNRYRSAEEMQYWQERNPILRYQKELKERFDISEEEQDAVLKRVEDRMEDVCRFAVSSPEPDPESLKYAVFSDGGAEVRV